MNRVALIIITWALLTFNVEVGEIAQQRIKLSLNGVVFSNLPSADGLASGNGKKLLGKFRKRFGEPQSGVPIGPISFESFRNSRSCSEKRQEPDRVPRIHAICR